MSDPPVGYVIRRYKILARLGGDDTRTSYLAKDRNLDRKVTLTVFTNTFSSDTYFNERLMGGMRAAATLDHPNIDAVFEFGSADGRAYVVTQYPEGVTLRLGGTTVARDVLWAVTLRRAAKRGASISVLPSPVYTGFHRGRSGTVTRDVAGTAVAN